MSKGFTCVHCGFGSLVRSNFKLTPRHEPYCRDEEGCRKRTFYNLRGMGLKWEKPSLQARVTEALCKIIGDRWTIEEEVIDMGHYRWIITAAGITWDEPLTTIFHEIIKNHSRISSRIDVEFKS